LGKGWYWKEQNFQVKVCDDQTNDSEIIDLASYNTNLIASATGNTFSYYKSLSGAQNQSASERISNFSSYPLQIGTTTIYVRIDNVNTCHQIVTLQLALFGNPKIPIQDIMPICEGSSITVDAGSGNDSYSWSTGASSQQITVSTPGNYSVSVTQNHNSVNCNTNKNFKFLNSNFRYNLFSASCHINWVLFFQNTRCSLFLIFSFVNSTTSCTLLIERITCMVSCKAS